MAPAARAVLVLSCVAVAVRGVGARSHGSLPTVRVLSPLQLGLYDQAGSVPVVVQVSGADPVAHSAHELVVRLNIEHEGWREMTTWSLREGKPPTSHPGPASAWPAEFRSTFIDIPRGRHTLEVALQSSYTR